MSQNQTVVVAGATGRVGRMIVTKLHERGYTVRAILVPPYDASDQPDLVQAGTQLVEADLTDVHSLEQAVAGADFLISAIGSRKPFNTAELNRIDNMGNQNLVRAAAAQKLAQVVVVSSNGVGDSQWAVSTMHRLMMWFILKAKERSENFIRACGVNYTIIRPGGYNEEGLSGKIVFGEGGGISGRVSRGQIARVCVDALANEKMKNRTLEVMDDAKVKEERRTHIIEL